jgi:hypothetical protein
VTANGQHPAAGLAPDPAHIIPAPPPAPTQADAQRVYGAQAAQPMPTSPPVQQAQPQPVAQPVAAAQPVAQAESAPVRRGLAGRISPGRQHALIVGCVVAAATAPFLWGRISGPDAPDPLVVAMATEVSTLKAQLATATKPDPIEVNPLNVMPCGVTNDARRFIGVDQAGALVLGQSINIAKAVQDHLRRGTTDYGVFVVRTGTSISQLEVDVQGRGVQLFDCGRPSAAPTTPTTVAPAPATPTTVVR